MKILLENFLCKYPKVYYFLRVLLRSKDWEKNAFLKIVKQNWTVVEIRANQGYLPALFHKLVGNKGVVHASEPIPSTFEHLLVAGKTKTHSFFGKFWGE